MQTSVYPDIPASVETESRGTTSGSTRLESEVNWGRC